MIKSKFSCPESHRKSKNVVITMKKCYNGNGDFLLVIITIDNDFTCEYSSVIGILYNVRVAV